MTRQVYGPVSLTLGSPFGLKIPQSTVAIQLRNDSRFDVLVSFAPTTPTNLTGSLDGTWQEVALRSTNPVIPIQTPGTGVYEKRTNAIGGSWNGQVWLLPIASNASELALAGVYSSLTNVWITTYQEDDTIPDSDSTTRQVDIVNQPRVISVPVVPSFAQANAFTNVAVNTYEDASAQFGSDFPNYTGVGTVYNFYLYAVCASLHATGPSILYQLSALSFQLIDTLNVQQGIITQAVFETWLLSSGQLAFASFTPANPLCFQQIVPGGLTHLPLKACPVITTSGPSGGVNNQVHWTIAWDVSTANGNQGPGGPFGGIVGTSQLYAGEVF